jgi:hypothetical protein
VYLSPTLNVLMFNEKTTEMAFPYVILSVLEKYDINIRDIFALGRQKRKELHKSATGSL